MSGGISVLRMGVILATLVAGSSLEASLALAQSRTDPMLNSSPSWDANHDGTYTCEEWKNFMDRLFVSADKGRKGFLTRQEFDTVKKADPSLAEADFGYFDENQDGKISRKEFVDKPSVFILRFDRNGDCKVTPEELKAAQSGTPQGKPRDRFH